MSEPETTCWTMIRSAAEGTEQARAEFAKQYAPVIRAYLLARWGKGSHASNVDDAVQEVFVECYRPGGALERVDPDRAGGFRAFLFGLTRNVARRFEERHLRSAKEAMSSDTPHAIEAEEDSYSVVFDRAWAKSLMRQAREWQAVRAAESGTEAVMRVELLRLRFESGLPIREIAKRWCQDPALVHRAYVKARKEFQEAIYDRLAFHGVGASQLSKECSDLLAFLA